MAISTFSRSPSRNSSLPQQRNRSPQLLRPRSPRQHRVKRRLPRRPLTPSKPRQTISASQESELTVENELYKIVLTNHGALVKHWILKKSFDSSGKPLDLVQPEAAARFGLPLSLFTYEPVLTSQLNQALYQSTVTGAQPASTGLIVAPASVTFHYAANGLDVVKTLHFDSSYVVTVETEVKREWPAGPRAG